MTQSNRSHNRFSFKLSLLIIKGAPGTRSQILRVGEAEGEIWGAFHSTKKSDNSGTGANGTEISRGKLPAYPKSVEVSGRLRSLSIRPNFPEFLGEEANRKEIFRNFILSTSEATFSEFVAVAAANCAPSRLH